MDEAVKHSILLVDDEPEILFSLKSLLRREFELFTAESGEDALRILSQQPVDIVMTDQRMPNMSGAELIEEVRRQHPDTIRIIFTGYADSKAVVDAINRGEVYRYITKPWDPDELIEVLHAASRRHALLAEHRQFLRDARRYLAESQAVTEQIRSGGSVGDLSAELDDCLAASAQLVERLDRIAQEVDGDAHDQSTSNE